MSTGVPKTVVVLKNERILCSVTSRKSTTTNENRPWVRAASSAQASSIGHSSKPARWKRRVPRVFEGGNYAQTKCSEVGRIHGRWSRIGRRQWRTNAGRRPEGRSRAEGAFPNTVHRN